MNDDQKWLEAAIALEHDILYLKSAARAGDAPELLEKEIKYLKVALAVYKKNATSGVPWPSPDDLFCIHTVPSTAPQIATSMRRDYKFAAMGN
jgi:hypothetical protein